MEESNNFLCFIDIDGDFQAVNLKAVSHVSVELSEEYEEKENIYEVHIHRGSESRVYEAEYDQACIVEEFLQGAK